MAVADSENRSHTERAASPNGPLTWAALVVALTALFGSLALSLALNLKACPLCFYQRTFVMSLAAMLGTGLMFDAGRAARLSILALPLATAGLGVAAFHVFLESSGKLECPGGVFGLGTAPQQSLGMFGLLFVLLALDAARAPAAWGAIAGTTMVGGLLALASCTSNPPPPPAPTQPYAGPPEICRPPFHAP